MSTHLTTTQPAPCRTRSRAAFAAVPLCAATAFVATAFAVVSFGSGGRLGAAPAPPISARSQQQKSPRQTAQQQKARQVTATLTRLLRARVTSPGGQLKLTVSPAARADLGYFSEIALSGRPAQVKKLRVTEFWLRARQVRVNVPDLLRDGELQTLSSRTSLRAVVTENDLTALLARGRSTAAMGLRVKYLGDRIRVSGNWKWGWFNGPVVGVGKLRLAPGHKVNFDILSLKLNGAEVPGFVKARFSQSINPVISYEDIPFQPRFRALRFQGSKAILSA